MKSISHVGLTNADSPADAPPPSAVAKRSTWAQAEGAPLPHGVTWIENEQAFNFAIHSEHVESVTLLLYSTTDLTNPILTFRFDFLRNKSGRIWHCRIPATEIGEARYYADGSLNWGEAPIFSELAADPELGQLRLIAEPWDTGAYQLGRGFPGLTWQQWNGRFRDDVRRFLKGDAAMVPDLMRRIYGSDDLFPDSRDHAYHAYQTVNYVTSHDGFTLYDLTSYHRKHNQMNGHNNLDGMDDNFSWNCGHEGDEAAPTDIRALRRKQVKNFCCLLLLSNGVPMFRAGDEFLNTQSGNNNPYNQDNETGWLDWSQLQANQDIFRFFKGMISFRKSHPTLSRSRFWREDVSWYGTGPTVDLSHDSRSLAFCLHGASQGDDDIYAMINAYWEQLEFHIQEGTPQERERIVDTDLPTPDDFSESGVPLKKMNYEVAPRSIVVLRRPRRNSST